MFYSRIRFDCGDEEYKQARQLWDELARALKSGSPVSISRLIAVAARNFIAGKGYVPRAESIRRCRQELMSEENIAQFRTLSLSPDFYGMSACRDLNFHVQEHRYTPSQLKENLAELEVDFLGFSLNAGITKLHSERFPDNESKTNLDYWDSFEAATPFTGMYEFWLQKRASQLI